VSSSETKLVHVIQGLSAAGSFRQAMHPNPGELLVHQDDLSCGPLPPFRSFEQWSDVRHEFWDSVCEDPERCSDYEYDVTANQSTLRDADSIVIWLALCASEQLFLAWLIQALKLLHCRARVSVIQFTRTPRNMDAWGMGLLHPEHISAHPPIVELSGEAISELERHWAAVTSPEPAGLLSVLSSKQVHLPHFQAGLRTLVHRYPDPRTGLGRWDLELLKNVAEKGPRATRVIGHTIGERLDADLVGDIYVYWRLLQLGALDRPLVSISGGPEIRTCQVSLTPAGQAVLEGLVNAIELNGIDDWVLGVHLSSSDGAVWYHKDGALLPAT
jgi:hypothetical protein